MGSIHTKTATFKTKVTKPINTKETKVLRFNASRSPAPYCSEKMAPLPMHNPKSTEVKNIISE